MNIEIHSDYMDSTYYRILFELIKELGIDAIQNLLNDLKELEKESLGEDAILQGKHRTLSLINRNKKVVEYLRKHKKELEGKDLLHPYVRSVINELVHNPDLLDTYLENAKLLEKYKIGIIEIVSKMHDGLFFVNINTGIYYNKANEITNIIKYYTDGEIEYLHMREEYYNYKEVKSTLKGVPTSWILRTENHADGRQFRYIYITGFDFNPEKFPTEEELQSYELPSELKLQLKK